MAGVKSIIQSRNFQLYRGKHKRFDQTERDERQHQDDEKEHDAAIFETLASNDFNSVEQPVGCQVENGGHQSVVNDFQDYFLKCRHAHYMMLSGFTQSASSDYFCRKDTN